MSRLFHRIACRFTRIFGWSLRWVQINRVAIAPESRGILIKHRKWYGWIPIMIGNFVLRFRHPRLYVLPTPQWLAWEQQIQPIVPGNDVYLFQGHGLNCKILPGEPLAKLLIQVDQDRKEGVCRVPTSGTDDAKEVEALTWAAWGARALAELHGTVLEFYGDDEQNKKNMLCSSQTKRSNPVDLPIRLSHGDAGISNLMIDLASQSAQWFDFDLRHDLQIASDKRQADDLRAFLFTLGLCFRWISLASLVQTVRHEYRSGHVWSELAKLISHGKLDFDFFHAAQLARCGGCHWDRMHELEEVILAETTKS